MSVCGWGGWSEAAELIQLGLLHATRPPGLKLMREPDELGLERAHAQLALGMRVVELGEANSHVPADDDGTPARLDDDDLQAARVARCGDQAEPGQELELAVDRLVAHAGRVDPLADGVVVLGARVLELLPLNVDRPSGEEVVAAAVVEVQVRVDDDVDAGEVEGLLAEWDEAGVEVGHLRMQLRHAGVDQDSGSGMVDDVDVDRRQRSPSTSNSATSSGVIVGGVNTNQPPPTVRLPAHGEVIADPATF
jgi:hypothetical protein